MRITGTLSLVASAFGLLTVSGGVFAQSFTVNWHTIGGGGGTSTGGSFALDGTLGQPDANPQPLTGGAFSLTGGFWSITAVQAPGAPLLAIERDGSNVRIFWPLPAADFVLDQSLTATGMWSRVALPYVTNATEISVGVPTSAGNAFYRLRKL